MNTLNNGRYSVWVDKHWIGENLVLLVGGGEKPHIGGIVVCEPDKPPLIFSLPNHRDTIILEIIAFSACKKYNTTCVAIGGIHIDNASKEEINRIIENCRKLAEEI